jgi:signal transduction histidine kinase
VGALYLADPEAREFTPDQVGAAQVLASLLAVVMEHHRRHGESQVTFEGMLSAQEQHIQMEKARAVGAMAGGIANEFNNLLAVILGKTQLMLAREPNGRCARARCRGRSGVAGRRHRASPPGIRLDQRRRLHHLGGSDRGVEDAVVLTPRCGRTRPRRAAWGSRW